MNIGLFFILSGLLIGYMGRNRRFGFWGFFFATLVFTPLVSLVMLIAAIPPPQAATSNEQQNP